MAAPETEESFLARLADAPNDASVRAEFHEWLAARDDPRAEVLALHAKGTLTSAERRTVTTLTERHSHRWLGPLAPLVRDFVFTGGLLTHVQFRTLLTEHWARATGDPRLGTVTSFSIGPGEFLPLDDLLAHPVMRNVTRLECGAAALVGEHGPRPLAFKPTQLRVHLIHAERDLALLRKLQFPAPLDLLGLVFPMIGDSTSAVPHVLAPPLPCESLEVTLEHYDGPSRSRFFVEAVKALRAAEPLPIRRLLTRMGGEVSVEAPQFDRLSVELAPPLWSVDRFTWAPNAVAERVRWVTHFLEGLGGGGFERVDVASPPGGRLMPEEATALRVAARRMGATLAIGGEVVG